MLRKAYTWLMDRATHDHAKPWLAVVSFAESSFFPLPPDVMLIPMVLAQPKAWFRLATICTLASVVGGYLGYAIGAFAMDSIGQAILGAFHLTDKFEALRPCVERYGFWIILLKGMTPIPYKLITITAGAFKFNLAMFTLASVGARGMRFYAEALLLRIFGESIRDFIEHKLVLFTTLFAVLIVGGVMAIHYLMPNGSTGCGSEPPAAQTAQP